MMRGKAFLTVAGLILAAAGVALFNLGQPAQKTEAQATGDYTTDWVATELYRLKFTNINNSVTANSIAIGVYKWVVNGSFTSGPSFTETWSGPDPISAKLTLDQNQAIHCSTNGYDRSLWLLGCIDHSGIYNIDINVISAAPNSVYFEGPQGYSGGGASCFFGVLDGYLGDCIVTTGTYGFSYVEQPNGNAPSEGDHFSGLMMPLKWTVIGTVN